MNRFSYFGETQYKDMKIHYKKMKLKIGFTEYLENGFSQTLKNKGIDGNVIDEHGKVDTDTAQYMAGLLSQKQLYNDIYHGNCSNIFIDSLELYNFLKITKLKIENSQVEIIKHQIYNHVKRSGIIYFPDNSIPCVCYSFVQFEESNFLACYITDGTWETTLQLPSKGIAVNDWIEAKAFYNMLLYMDCFPDSIINNPPDDVKKQYAPYIKRCFTIKSDESLIDRSGVTPHFRRGHFRVLRSEVFKKKRYQTIFVHSSFVKGKAKTVIDNPEKEIILK